MKLTPDTIAEAADRLFGQGWSAYEPALEPGQSEFDRNLKAMQADRCTHCGSWWECDEVMGHEDLDDDERICIECADRLSSDQSFGWRLHEAYSDVLRELQDRVEFRTLDEARADDRAAEAVAEFQTILNIIGHRLNREAPSIGEHLFNAHRLRPDRASLLAARLDGFAERHPEFRRDAADAKHCLDAIVMLRAA